jgi:hypothetical protein
MSLSHSLLPDELWNQLQAPSRLSAVDAQFRQVIAAIDLGWHVEEPVYLRPRWTGDSRRVYHFILKRAPVSTPRLITVPEGPAVERFVRDEYLRVVEAD